MGVFSYEVRHVLGSAYSGGGTTFLPSGRQLLTAQHGRLQLTDLTGGRACTLAYEAGRSLTCISVRGARALALDAGGRVALVALPSGRVLARMSPPGAPARAVRFSRCGAMVALSGPAGVTAWRLPAAGVPEFAAFRRVAGFRAAGAAAKGCLDWGEGGFLAVGGEDGVVFVFCVREPVGGKGRVKPLVLYGHREPVVLVRFVGERGLVSVSRDGVMLCWRLRVSEDALGGVLAEVEDEGDEAVDNEVVVPMEARLASRHFVKAGGGRRVRSAAVAQGMLCVGMSNGVFGLFQLPDAMREEDDEFDKGLFEIGDAARKRRRDARKEAKRRRKEGEEPEEYEEKHRSPFTELQVLHTLSAAAGAITDVEFSPTGDWLALASSHAGQITVWEWRSETHVLKQQAHTLAAASMAFSPDGRAVATGSRDGRVKLWSVANGFCAATFADHTAAVSAVTFAANDVIVSASLDGTVRAFDIRRYRNFRVLVGPPPRRQFGCVAVDGAGELVAAGCVDTFEIIVWSLRTGNVLELLAGHKGPVCSIAFRPHRGTLASASWDRTVRMWDMYERKGSCEVLEHSKEVLSVCFRPDGKELASTTMAGEVLLWDADQGVVSGSIDGARDAAGGRLRDSRTSAPQRGHFQSLVYSADGRFVVAGAASKYVCVYNVTDGTAPSLVDRYAVSDNKDFDGLIDELNSKHLTAGGFAQEVIEDDDEMAENIGEAKIADGRSLPGARSDLKTKRMRMIKAEVKCVHFCATGRLWGAVTPEGAMVYADSALGGFGASEDTVVFDPTNLEVDVTPEVAMEASRNGEHETALLVALRLNERDVLSSVIEAVPHAEIDIVIRALSAMHFSRLVLALARRIDNGPHLAFDLTWARRLLTLQGSRAHAASADPSSINTALRALYRAVSAHSKRIAPLATRNEDTLKYLFSYAELNSSEAAPA